METGANKTGRSGAWPVNLALSFAPSGSASRRPFCLVQRDTARKLERKKIPLSPQSSSGPALRLNDPLALVRRTFGSLASTVVIKVVNERPPLMQTNFAAWMGFVLALSTAMPARADDVRWPPAQPIKFVVPTSAGGGTDTIARAMAERLQPAIGATFIVEDKPGGSGNIGTVMVKEAKPDGTTLLFTQAAHTSNVA